MNSKCRGLVVPSREDLKYYEDCISNISTTIARDLEEHPEFKTITIIYDYKDSKDGN